MSDNEPTEESPNHQDSTNQPEIPKYSDTEGSQSKSDIEPDGTDEEIEVDEQEKEKIEEEIKNIAKEYEKQEDEDVKSQSVQLMITGLFVFGPIFYLFLAIFDTLFGSFHEVIVDFSLTVSGILLLLIIWESYKKSKRS